MKSDQKYTYQVFISYRWTTPDQEWVREHLHPALVNAGLKVCLDVNDFVPGRDVILEMERAGMESRHVLCVISPAYLEEGRMVEFESLTVRRRDPGGRNSHLIPLIFQTAHVPERIRGLIPVDWTVPEGRAREWKRLLTVLGAPNADAPWPGAPDAETASRSTAGQSSRPRPAQASALGKARAILAGRRLMLALLAVALVALTGWVYYGNNSVFESYLPGRRPINSVAVLPFTLVTTDPDTDYLADGLTNGLINTLSQLPDLKVIASSSTFRYKGKDVDPQTLGRDLQVQSLLAGRITQRGDVLTINIELVDIRENRQVWGRQYNQSVSGILTTQQLITKEVTERLRLKLPNAVEQRLEKMPTTNPEAYQYYLKGRYQLDKRNEDGLKKGLENFNRAIEIDPSYALAYTGLADYYILASTFNLMTPHEAYPRARAAALNALRADDSLAEAHTSLAYVMFSYEWDWEGAEREFKRAIELNPNYVTAHRWQARFLTARGRLSEAVEACERARTLDPLSLTVSVGLAQTLLIAGRVDEATDIYRSILEMDQNYLNAHFGLGLCYLKKGMEAKGLESFQRYVALSSEDNPLSLFPLGYAYAAIGRRADALKIIERLQEQRNRRYVPAIYFATIYAALKDRQQTLAWLEKSFDERFDLMAYIKVDPPFEDFRSDPQFLSLLRRMGLDS